MISIHSLDLNLIRVFDALIAEQNVTRAGVRLGLTQSAISHALKKLRHHLDDDLFVRGPDGMHPTPRAEALAGPLHEALTRIEMAITATDFDPSTSDLTFVVAASDYTIATLFPPVLRRLRDVAPGTRVRLRPLSDLNLVDELDRGTLHVAIGDFGDFPTRFVKEPWVAGTFVWAMRADHPAAKGQLTPSKIARHPHVDVVLLSHEADATQGGLQRVVNTSDPAALDAALAAEGLTRHVAATVSHFLAVPPLLAATDMIAAVPQSIDGEPLARYGLIGRPSRLLPPAFELSILSHQTMGSAASVAWFRALLREVAAS